MTSVVVDGIKFVPESSTAPARVGIAVTTHNRHDVLAATLAAITEHTPDEYPVVVVDDGSTEPVKQLPGIRKLIRNETPQGIPAAKNRCVQALMELGVDHLFLLDDDTRPAAPDWWKPYTESPEPHLQYCWTHFKEVPAQHRQPRQPPRAVPKMNVLYEDSTLRAYGWSMGCMLYVTADVIRRVGGMHWGFGQGMEEHAEWSQRIHNAGFTSFVHQDIPTSQGLFYASDEHGTVARSFNSQDRAQLLARNEQLRLSRLRSTEYVDYRPPRDVVLTSYLAAHPDPQRNEQQLPADWKALQPLMLSTESRAVRLEVLHDCLDSDINKVESSVCAYRQRWLNQWRWLRDHPDVRYCWMVDATDVVMLNDPFPHMKPDTLYTGWETRPVGCEWLRNNSPKVIDWIDGNAHRMLLNCGVVGGDRNTMLRLCQRMNDLWVELDAEPLHEMAFFNIAAYEHPNLVTGPQVATTFKREVKNDAYAFWKHK